MVWSRQLKNRKKRAIKSPRTGKAKIKNARNVAITQRKKRKESLKSSEESLPGIEADENFAFIIGYTSGGAAYGLTYEEFNMDDDFTTESNHDEVEGDDAWDH